MTAAALTSLPSQLHIVLDWLFTLIECGYAVRNLYFDVEPSVVRSKDISLLLIVAMFHHIGLSHPLAMLPNTRRYVYL